MEDFFIINIYLSRREISVLSTFKKKKRITASTVARQKQKINKERKPIKYKSINSIRTFIFSFRMEEREIVCVSKVASRKNV